MHITLTYEGKLWGNSRKISDVSNIRKYFSDLLEKFSNTEQFDYVKNYSDPNPSSSSIYIGKKVGDFVFIPFISKKMNTTCSLKIHLLRGLRPHNPVLYDVDLDNRVKTLIDCLRAPSQMGEIDPKFADRTPYVLLEDDCLVSGLTVTTDHYLANDNGDTVFAMVTAEIRLSRARMDNLHLGL